MLKLSYWGRARQGILAHTHGLVVFIKLTHLTLLAVMVEAGVWERKCKKKHFLPELVLKYLFLVSCETCHETLFPKPQSNARHNYS